MKSNRVRVIVAATAALTMGLAACSDKNKEKPAATSSGSAAGSGSASASGAATAGANAGVDNIFNPSTEKGGTLRMAQSDDWDSLDGADTYYAYSWDFIRLYGRGLTVFKAAPGAKGSEVVPDLAESLGKPSDDAKTWTYKLRTGVKYEDGTPITSKDVKYAVERSLDKDIYPNGPTYFNDFLDLKGYKGPYKDKGKPNASIETPDDQTIVFHLNKTFAGFDYFAQLPATIPVPQAKDTGSKYKEHVFSSGPYKFESNELGKRFTLVRNENYDPATDPDSGRLALPDKIEVSVKVNADDVDNRLISGDLDVDILGTGVQPAAQGKILKDAALKAKTDSATVARTWYTTLNTDVAPFDNIDCRKAVLLAADRTGYQRAYGGATGGEIATSLMPPVIPGYQKYDPYNAVTKPEGDVEGAKAALKACGKPDGFEANISFRGERPKEKATAEALQQSLARVGIRLTLKPYPAGDYYKLYAGNVAYSKANKLGLRVTGWGADWPDGFGFLSQIVDSRTIRPAGNYNLGIKLPAVDAALDKALATTDVKAREPIWGEIDKLVMDNALVLPGVWAKGLLFRPDNLTNVFVTNGFQMYDYAALGTTKK
jgi:peptide/nickel transport system substrate-binding protein